MKILATIVLGMSLMAGGCTTISPGYVGVKINQMGSARGVEDIPAVTGLQFYLPFYSAVFEYPTFNQQVKYTLDQDDDYLNEEVTFTTKDKMKIGVDVALSYFIEASQVPHFYVKFRSDDLGNFTHGFLKNTVRDSFVNNGGHYSIDDVMGDNSVFISEVKTDVEAALMAYGIKIDQFGIIGAPRPPAQVLLAIDETQKAKQVAIQLEAELKQSEASAAKRVAEAEGIANAQVARAKGEAEANRLMSSSITGTLLEWQRLQAQRESIGKWDGTLPTTVLGGNTPTILQIPTFTRQAGQ